MGKPKRELIVKGINQRRQKTGRIKERIKSNKKGWKAEKDVENKYLSIE